MKFLANIFCKSNTHNLKMAKVNDDWVVMRDYSIVYLGSKDMCLSYLENFLVAA